MSAVYDDAGPGSALSPGPDTQHSASREILQVEEEHRGNTGGTQEEHRRNTGGTEASGAISTRFRDANIGLRGPLQTVQNQLERIISKT